MFGQLCVVPDEPPGPGVVDGGELFDGAALFDGEALVDGPMSGETLGDGDVAACATTKVPNPPARPTLAAITILTTEPRNHPGLFMA